MATYNIDYTIYMDNGVLQRWDDSSKAYVNITDSNITDHLYYSNGHWVMYNLDLTTSATKVITVRNGNATISVIGTNSITASPDTSNSSSYGISSSSSNVTLQGSGELSITTGDVQNDDSIGIWLSGTLTLKESVTVTAKAGNSLNRTSAGVQVDQLSVSDTASLTAKAGSGGTTEAAYVLDKASSSVPTDAVTSTDLALNPVTFDTNKKTYVDGDGNTIKSLNIQAYDGRTVVTPSTGTKENPKDLGTDKTITAQAYASGNGGALEVQTGAYATGTNLTYASNSVTGTNAKGGAICNAGYLELSGASFSGNSATDAASGAVYNTGKLLMTGDITLATSSDTVYNEGSLIWNFTGDNVAKVVNYEYVTNATTEEGIPAGILGIWVDAAESLGNYVIATGALSDYATNPAKYAFSISTDGETFAGLTLSNKVYFNNRLYTLALNEGKTELTLTVENGTAPGQRLVVEDEEWITIQEDTVYDFTSQAYYAGNGGIIEVQSGGTFTNRPDTVLQFINGKSSGSDKSVSVGGESYKSAGGAIYSAGVVNLKSATFTNNRASGYHSGGAVYSTNDLTLSNANFTGNASERDGGAICVSGGTANVTGSTFGNNTASYSGGAIRLQAGTLNMSDVTFTNNKATSVVGGAISFRTGTAVIDKATFTGNTSKDSGGAVFNSASNITIKNSKFKGNQSAKGGAIVNGYMSEGNAVLYLDNVTFGGDSAGDNNTATSGNGNAIYNIAGNTIHLLGDVYLMTSNETIYLESGSKLDWVISDTDGTLGYVNDYFLISGTKTKDTLTIDAEDALQSEYILAGDASNADEQEFTITTADGTSQTITVNGSTVTDATYGTKYTLAVNTDYELVLKVEKANVTLSVFSQEKTYDGTTDLVNPDGYLFTGLAAGFTGSATLTNDKSDAGDYTDAIDATDITIKNGQDDVTKYYNVTTNKGKLTINKREVTVTGTTADGKMYDGSTDATVHLGTVGNTIEGDDITVTAAGEFDNKNAGNGRTVTITYTLSGDDAGNYTVDSGDTIADIDKRDVTLTSASSSKTYDGTALTDDTVTESGSGFIAGEGAEYTVTGSQTKAGSSANPFTYTLNEGTSADNYEISMAEGTLEITKRDVTLTSASGSKTYDGTALTDDTVTVTGSGWADGEGAEYTVTGSQTKAGSSANPFTYTLNEGTSAENYEISTAEGTLEITKRDVTLTSASGSKTYDGTALTDDTVTESGSGFIAGEGAEYTVTGSQTKAGSSANPFTYTLNEGTSAENYEISTVEGELEVTKRDVTLTSGSDEKTYDGTPLTNDTVTVTGSGWADGEGAEYNVTGSRTEVGSSANTFTYTLNEGTIADNYDITTVEGTLTVTFLPPAKISNYNNTAKSDIVQVQNGLVYVMHDTASGYEQSAALNDIDSWTVTEFRRDLTGDGLADVQITKDAGDGTTWVAALRNDYLTDGTTTLNYQFIGAYNNELWSYLGSADTNGDGKAEVLMEQTELGSDQGIRHVAAWVTDGEGKWVDNEWVGGLSEDWSDVAGTADIDGNGTDNVILRRADGMIGYWSEAGTGDVVRIAESGQSVLISSGDFDGDKTDDLLFTNASGDFFTWSNIGGDLSNVKIGNLSDLGESWSFAGTGDYNGDGKDELLWCDGTNTAYSEADKDNFSKLVQIA